MPPCSATARSAIPAIGSAGRIGGTGLGRRMARLAGHAGACHNDGDAILAARRMNVPETGSRSAPLSRAALWSGYAGIVPFVACLVAVLWAPQPQWRGLAQQAAIAYGAVILSFVGALHWALALAGRLPGNARTISASVLPSVAATAAVLLAGQRGLALLIVGFGAFWIYEHRCCGRCLPADYLALRRRLTLAVCATLALTLFASDAAGLR